MLLDPRKDYGFTDLGVSDTEKLPVWDKFRLEKVQEIFDQCERILDFGNSSRALSELLSIELEGKERITVDINECYDPDVVADICDLQMFGDESIDGIICAAILEHVYNPFKAVSELFRVLRPMGKMFAYVPWIWRYHAATGKFLDYFRYSCDGSRYLLRDFSHVELCPVRGYIETILNLVPKLGKRSRFHRWFRGVIRKIDKYDERYASGFNIYVVK